jgi:hypothetical protein
MKNHVGKTKNLSQRIEILWDRTEEVILRFFDTYSPGNRADQEENPGLPKMTDFNIITAAIKRLQEARFALLKQEVEYETHSGTQTHDPEGTQEDLCRILKALELTGTHKDPPEGKMQD